MIVSHRHKFIFVHLHKCAGTSITRALIPYLGRNDLVFGCTPKFEKLSNKSRSQGGLYKHSTAREIREYVGEPRWNDYFKFSFVRNPWDLTLSKYYWWHKTPANWNDDAVIRKKEVMEMSFAEFVRTLSKRQGFYDRILSSTDDEVPSIDLDFIGRYETLDADFEKICKELHFPPTRLLSANTSKELRQQPSYTDHYDEQSKDVVAKLYAREIERFGYAFSG